MQGFLLSEQSRSQITTFFQTFDAKSLMVKIGLMRAARFQNNIKSILQDLKMMMSLSSRSSYATCAGLL